MTGSRPIVRKGALALGCASLVATAALATEAPPQEADERTRARGILAAAFERRHGIDFTSTIELVIRNGTGQELRRRFLAASKVIGGRIHSLGRLVWPEYLRGMAILTIEAEGRDDDTFVYLPSMQKVRRVSTAQRRDSFLEVT